jgi:hypothetical protein
MAVGVKHYKRDGSVFSGKSHKMSDGTLHSGVNHTASSVKLFHFKDLSMRAKAKARKRK